MMKRERKKKRNDGTKGEEEQENGREREVS
jgi:hypothetical protein